MSTENESKKKMSKKRWVIYALLLFVGGPQMLLQTGFCFQEMQYLSKREIVDRLLFSEQGSASFDGKTRDKRSVDSLSLEEKMQMAMEQNLGEYPYNCRVMLARSNGLYLFYSIDCTMPYSDDEKDKGIYKYKMHQVNGCGYDVDYFGDTVDSNTYKFEIERNKKYWNGK